MDAESSIEWTDATWNPIRGCSMAKGSEAGGCLTQLFGLHGHSDLPFGAIIGRVGLVGCCRMRDMPAPTVKERELGNWSPDRYAWQFENPVLNPAAVIEPIAVTKLKQFIDPRSTLHKSNLRHPEVAG